ncbi:FAD-dependent oxidoreductase [Cellulosimicrobium sp. PMB13]|uniref:NAD(P)/FAD-dependent oxidoreductase n=1 Tax=Cellulosimicrobium sp. PMB13 TaxID=3120158 RepID=UPI003F4C6C3F
MPSPARPVPSSSLAPEPTSRGARSPVPSSVVVVGAGLAGARTVAALRQLGFDGTLTLLGAEGVPPYDRPPLSKELLTRPGPAWLVEDLGIDVATLVDDLRLADPAVGLTLPDDDAHAFAVTTRSGDVVRADAVVLAVGSEPVRPLGWETASVLHTTADAAALRERVAPGLRLAVVGAGWIGAEIAGVAAGAGAEVTVVEAGATPLERQLGPAVGTHLARWYADAGARLVTGVPVVEVRPDGVLLADGTQVAADVVLAAVGARPATAWLDGAVPRDARGAVPVDATGAVRDVPGLWAVGDCATRDHPVLGPVPGGHWSAALHDPEPTARALMGLDADDAPPHPPYVFSQQLGHDLALFGTPAVTDEVVLRGDPAGGATGREAWAALYVEPDDGTSARRPDEGGRAVRRVRAVLLVDSPRDVGAVRRLFTRTPRPELALEQATDPSVRWRDLAAAAS